MKFKGLALQSVSPFFFYCNRKKNNYPSVHSITLLIYGKISKKKAHALEVHLHEDTRELCKRTWEDRT